MSDAIKTEETCYSDFWLEDTILEEYVESDEKNSSTGPMFTMDLIKLAGYRRVISNFVSILTNQDIPVKYLAPGGTGATDGKTVFISASITKKTDFDWCVGLALHEAAHIVKTDFEAFLKLWTKVPPELYKKGRTKNINNEQIADFCKGMFNVVEDRYIDSYIFKEAPGYRGYYKSLYNRIWNSKAISAALKSKMYRENTLDSYDYRIIYLTNPSTDLDALPVLRKIAEKFEISSILRLKTTQERMDLSFEIVEMIIDNIDCEPKQDSGSSQTIKKVKQMISKKNEGESGEGGFSSTSPEGESKNEPKDETPSENQEGGNPKEKDEEDVIGGNESSAEKTEDKPPSPGDGCGDVSEFTPSQIDKIKKQFERNKELLRHEFESIKKEISKEQIGLLDIIEQSGIHISHAHFSPDGCVGQIKPVDCIVINNLTKELLLSGREIFPLSTHDSTSFTLSHGNAEQSKLNAVLKGWSMGKKLGKKLQIRNETNVIKYPRRSNGKIDKRILADLGAGMENVFYKIKKNSYNRAKIHISVDASGSMDCDAKWNPTITCVTAICVACSMIQNIDVSVSFRSTHSLDGKDLPYIVLAYDSTKDKISKVRQLFPFLKANGATPEGLAFEAILDDCIINRRGMGEDHYFVNLSDGEPCYTFYNRSGGGHGFSYGGDDAAKHTKRQVGIMKSNGIKILSYFIKTELTLMNNLGMLIPIKSEVEDKTLKQFKTMYGKDARSINIDNVGQIAKTMNELFLKKE